MISIRPANESDVEALCSLDHKAVLDHRRGKFINRSVAADTCYVALVGTEVIGYGVLNYSFYDQGWVAMLYVHCDHRRGGAGTALLRHIESVCQTPKLFTSTNLSNLPMQEFLNALGYSVSGVIHNLDESDPEIVYFKLLR